LTFAEAVEQVRVGDCGRSRLPIDDRDKFAAERPHPKVANWRCRLKAARRFLPELTLGTGKS
jgi:hypothetical protein